MLTKLILKTTCFAGLITGYAITQTVFAVAPATGPANGITMDMMPITQEQLTQCRQQGLQPAHRRAEDTARARPGQG